MFREMRRKNKNIETDEVMKKLNSQKIGILSVIGDNEYPYGVPVHYSIYDGKLIFHSANEGHKVDSIEKHDKVGFTIVLAEETIAEKFSANFESIVIFGRARKVTKIEEKKPRLLSLIDKFSSQFIKEGKEYIDRAVEKTGVYEIEIEHITGKKSER